MRTTLRTLGTTHSLEQHALGSFHERNTLGHYSFEEDTTLAIWGVVVVHTFAGTTHPELTEHCSGSRFAKKNRDDVVVGPRLRSVQ